MVLSELKPRMTLLKKCIHQL